MAEEMTSLERVVAALNYQKPDRVPCAPLVCGAARRVLGVTYDKWSMDAELAANSVLQAQELLGMDAMLALVDLSVEAYDFGQEVIFPIESTAYSNTNNPMIKKVEDYYQIQKINPRETPRMSMVIDIVRRWAQAKGNEVAIIGFVYGPLGVLSQMAGHEHLFRDCLRHPEAVMAAEEVITEVLIEYALAQIEAGAHSICLDTLYASGSIMGKKLWEKIEAPYAKKIAEAVKNAGVPLGLHNCGNNIYFDVQQKWLSPTYISHAYPADDVKNWAEHAEKWGKQIVTVGYAVPSEICFGMTPEEVMEECRQEIETFACCEGGFILAPGCEFPPNGTLLSALAMVRAAKLYGAY